MATHRAVHVKSAGEPLELTEVETTSPPPDHVRIAVNACGVCGTDHAFVTGAFPNLSWPITPGHEIAGTIAELGSGVEGFAVGDRVAVGWFGGNCNRCLPCRKGQFMQCVNLEVPSWNYPGGYAESVTVPRTALARIPDGLSFAEAAPMGCAGVTTYNALRTTRAVGGLAPQGELVIVGATFDPLPIAPGDLLFGNFSVVGHPSGTSADVEDTLHFAVQSRVRARIEERPLAEAAEAYAAMDEGRARYRMVLTM